MHPLPLVLVLLGAQPEAPRWERVSDRDGVRVEVQAVAGSGFERIRVSCATRAEPAVFMRALWGKATDSSASPEVVKRVVLIDEERVRRYWDLVHAPPASDRDYVLHEDWSFDERQAVTLRFATVDDPAKPVTPDLVRFGKIEGSFGAVPRPGGGSDLTYVVYTDLGGAIPAWLTRGAQREASRKFALEIRRRAEAAQQEEDARRQAEARKAAAAPMVPPAGPPPEPAAIPLGEGAAP